VKAGRSLADLVANGLCTGCGLCASIGLPVTMRESDRGFLRPVEETALTEDQLARLVALCPGVSLDGPSAERVPDAEAAVMHPVWGPVLGMHRTWAANPGMRFAGASGGAITAIAAHLLASGRADAVLHVGADPRSALRSASRYSVATGDVVERAGSRYAPSATLAGLDDALQRFERIAVIAKPCEIAGLRRLLAAEPGLADRIPWLLSFFCAGVPSLHGTEALLRQKGLEAEGLESLRYRGNGWPGRMTAHMHDGRSASWSYAQSWGVELHRHLQFRCKICADGTGEHADLVAADAWATKDGYPDFEERDGISALIVRTRKGTELFESAVSSGALGTAPLSLDELAAMQPYQVDRKRTLIARLAALRRLGGMAPRYRRQRLWRNGLRGGGRLFRNFAGTALRVLQGRHRE